MKNLEELKREMAENLRLKSELFELMLLIYSGNGETLNGKPQTERREQQTQTENETTTTENDEAAESRGVILSKIAPIIGPLIGRFFEHSGTYICEKITFTPQEIRALSGSSYISFKRIMINGKRSFYVCLSPLVYKTLFSEYGS